MKSTLLRLSVLLLTFAVGITIPLFFNRHRSTESPLAVPSSGVGSVAFSGCPDPDYIWKDMPLIIEVPNDREFYLGKRKIALSEISDTVREKLGRYRDVQVVFIKSAGSVRFETVSLIADQLRAANAKCIEFRLDKKKRP